MGIAGPLQVRLISPRKREAVVKSWCLPAFVHPFLSISVTAIAGNDLVTVGRRIADMLAIRDGDEVEFDLVELGDKVRLVVKVTDNPFSDVVIHDWISLGLAESVRMDANAYELTLKSGKKVYLRSQEMWAGYKIQDLRSTGCLCFGGTTKEKKASPSSGGYGFRISLNSQGGNEFVRGYGYSGKECTDIEMEYKGLMEGLIWAARLDLSHLKVYGSSDTVVRQMQSWFGVRDEQVGPLVKKAKSIIKERFRGTKVTFHKVAPEKNQIAALLADSGVESKETLIVCNWKNINLQMEIEDVFAVGAGNTSSNLRQVMLWCTLALVTVAICHWLKLFEM